MAATRVLPPVPTILDRWNCCGVADETLATTLGVSARTPDRWRRGMYPQTETRQRLAALDELYQRLISSFGDDDVEALRIWLYADNRYLGGLKPVDALKAGRFDRAEAAFDSLDEGFFVYHLRCCWAVATPARCYGDAGQRGPGR